MSQDKQASKVRKVTQSSEIPQHLEMKESTKEVKQKKFTMQKRGEQTVTHHLFKAKVAQFLKNESFKKDTPALHPVKHEHIYHTVDSRGNPIKYTGFVGGHCHEVITKTDSDGNITVECGPPLARKVIQDRAGRAKTVYKEISFFDKHANEGDGETIVDHHSHEMVYMGSEVWTHDDMKARGGARAVPVEDPLQAQRDTLAQAGVGINA